MADKRLNDLSTATDGAYIYAEDASGNQIKIAKADLATVVAGLMNWGTNYGGFIASTTSIDEGLANNTWYYCRTRSDLSEGFLYNITPSLSDAVKNSAIQIHFTLGGVMKTRVRSWSSGNWSTWA